jgi:hypothetical protein
MKKNSGLLPATGYLERSQSSNYMNDYPLISRLTDYIKIEPELYNLYIGQGIDLKMIITKAVDDSIQ